MKRKLKDFVSCVIILVFLYFGSLYYLNFEAKGDTAFVTTDEAVVFRTPSYNGKVIDKVYFGDDITIVKNGFTNYSPFVKIRIDDGESTKIGYIQEKMIGKYDFPNVDYYENNFLIFCDKNISLNEFVPEFRNIIENESIVGVYFDKDVIEAKNKSDLEYFCSSQKIPWGFVTDLDEDSIDTFEEAETMENSIPSNKKFEDYNILPVTFRSYSQNTSTLIEDINIPFVLLTNYVYKVNNVPNWINEDVKTSNSTVEEESIYAYTYKDYSYFSLVKTSENWSYEIRDAYETAREEAAE